jgi:hypothetical protein
MEQYSVKIKLVDANTTAYAAPTFESLDEMTKFVLECIKEFQQLKTQAREIIIEIRTISS